MIASHFWLGRRLSLTAASLLAALLLVPGLGAAPGRSAEPRAALHRSLVKVVSTSNPPDPVHPWRRTGPQTGMGSGVIIEGERVLTAAHVVADAVMIEVQRSDVSRGYTAEVEFVCHPCDLALLKVADHSFFEAAVPLKIGDLPRLQASVEVHGFPEGGEGLSVTSGIVSRIGVDYYTHSFRRLLQVQVDAAINPGNSGGPAISDGSISGIAMQTFVDAENIAYLVPAPVIRHFLEDVEDGRFDGFPELDVQVQPLINPALRRHLGADREPGGVLVTAVSDTGAASEILQPGDVLLAIGGTAIGEDNCVELGGGARVDAVVLEHRAQVRDTLSVRYLRRGAVHEKEVVMRPPSRRVPFGDYDRDPAYRIYAGLVFQPLNLRYLHAFEGDAGYFEAYIENPATSGYRTLLPEGAVPLRREAIVISGVLASEFNRGYEVFEGEIVQGVDGTPVRDLRHLSELLDESRSEFVTITLESGNVIVMNRGEVEAGSRGLLVRYRIPADRSPDLVSPGNAAWSR